MGIVKRGDIRSHLSYIYGYVADTHVSKIIYIFMLIEHVMISNFDCYAKYLLKLYLCQRVIDVWAWSLMPVIPACWEAEVGELLEPRSLRPA